MGRILKINHDYFVEFYGNGLRFRKKAGRTEEEARVKLDQIEHSISETALELDLTTVTVPMFVERFIIFAQEVYNEISFLRYQEALTQFEKFLEGYLSEPQFMREITPRVLEEYKAVLVKDYSPKDVNLALFLVRNILEHARTLRFLNDNPTQHIQFLEKGFDAPPPILKGGAQDAVAEGMAYQFVLGTGIKKEECVGLKWEDIHFEEMVVYIRSELLGLIQTRRVPLDPSFAKHLQKISADADDLVFPEAKWAEIPFPILQNTFAYNLLQRGVPLTQLNQFLGFEDVRDVYPYACYAV